MLKDQYIICFANDWFEDPTSKHHVIKILSRQNKILWINSISMRPPKVNKKDISRILKKISEYLKGIVKINENLHVFTPLVIPFPKYKIVRLLNCMILVVHINIYRKKLGFKKTKVITFIPNVNEILDVLKYDQLIYYCVDDWSKFSFINTSFILKEEDRLLKNSDLVLVTSRKLLEDKQGKNQNIHYLSHGVEVEHFISAVDEQTEVPADIALLTKPIIGFFGLIHDWINLDLMEKVARKYPEYNVVMIGEPLVDITKYGAVKNMHFLGKKKYQSLPGYCKKFDLAVLPFKINELTNAVNPIKLREYLSAGLPVLSTPIFEVYNYERIINIADGDEFVDLIPGILSEFTDQMRSNQLSEMKKESWESKVDQLSDLIEESVHTAPV